MMQTLKEWLIYYVHDETFLGKALNAFVERIRLTLQTILNSSDGSLAGDAFAVCCLLLVHLFFPMILIWLYYGFRLRQIKRGKITDPQYHIKAKKILRAGICCTYAERHSGAVLYRTVRHHRVVHDQPAPDKI